MNAMSRTAESAPAELLGNNLCELAAHLHAATAKLTRMAADFDDTEAWSGYGIRSCAHWLSINAGFDVFAADELLRVGHALTTLPQLAAAFAGGVLSLDKVRAVTRVATAHDEDLWVELARQASGSQLARICRGYRRAAEANAAGRAEAHLARRGLWAHWEDDGMLRLHVVLPPEDGALVLATVEAIKDARVALPGEGGNPDDDPTAATVPDPAYDTHAARRADALVAACRDAASGIDKGTAAVPRMVVHVDLGVLSGKEPEGRCQLQDGPSLSTAAARRIGCDAEVIAISERDGHPMNVGRAKRIVPMRLRRALQSRDSACCFPGCAVPARLTHAHHIEHWVDGGRTDLPNLASLCGFHHRRLHDGVYRIRAGEGVGLHFETANGRSITVRQLPPVTEGIARNGLQPWLADQTAINAKTARAGDGGRRCDFRYVVDTIVHGCDHARARAAADRGDAPGP